MAEEQAGQPKSYEQLCADLDLLASHNRRLRKALREIEAITAQGLPDVRGRVAYAVRRALTVAAFTAARSARFEHGEKGAG